MPRTKNKSRKIGHAKPDAKLTILIAEDSATQAAQLQNDLEEAGYEVIVARSGETALGIMRETNPSLLITDVNMPGMDGYELCRHVKAEEGNNVPVMLLTSLSDPLDVIRGLECGADSFTVKPYDVNVILSRITYVLAHCQLRAVEPVTVAIEIEFAGRKFSIRSDRLQILNLLLSSYETAVQKNRELIEAQERLKDWGAQLEKRVEERTSELRGEIEHRKREEAGRRESDERLHLLVSTIKDYAIIMLGPDGRIVSWTAGAETINGYSEAEAIGQSMDIFYVPEDVAAGRPRWLLTQARENGSCQDEGWRLRKDGSRFRAFVTLTSLYDSTGDIVGYSNITRDITERWKAQEEISAREALFRGVLDAAPDAIVVVDDDGRIVMANTVTGTMFGYTGTGLQDMQIESLVPLAHRDNHEEWRLAYQSVPRALIMGSGRPLEGMRKDGSTFPIEVSLSPVVVDGRPLVISIIRDLTERHELEDQLHHSQKMDAIGQLSGGIAHDFNNLLGVILGNLDLLEREVAGNEAILKRIAIAQKAAERGADLTRRLLAFSRRQPLSAGPISVMDCVTNIVEMARHTMGPDITLAAKIDPALPSVLADAGGLENVLLNLVVNARDAMPQGGAITIAARETMLDEDYRGVKTGELKPGRYICIAVTDTGVGIPPETLARAFEPFFTTKERGKGTGLGLAMVYGFAKQSGGHASIYSELGHGTTVKVYLPPAAEAALSRPAPQGIDSNLPLKGTALVVDDEVDLLEVAVAYLEELGLHVLYAQDGLSALALLQRTPKIDLLVTDVVMPGGMNGAELAQRIRELRPDVRIVFSTGFSSAALTGSSGIRVTDPVLNKPYRRTEFFDTIRKAMISGGGNGDGT